MDNSEQPSQDLRYLVMPSFVYKDNNLTDLSRRVYSFIHTFEREEFYFSSEHLAQMFNCSSDGIDRAIKKLKIYKYIKTAYKIKEGGGKIRYIIDLKPEPHSGTVPNRSAVRKNDTILVEEKFEKPKLENSQEYLIGIPENDLAEMSEKFGLSPAIVKEQAEQGYDWLQSTGRRYKNYKAFLRNSLRRHKAYLKINGIEQEPIDEWEALRKHTEEERKKNND